MNAIEGEILVDDLKPGMEVYWLQWGWSERKSVVLKVTEKQVRFGTRNPGFSAGFADKTTQFFSTRKAMLESLVRSKELAESRRRTQWDQEIARLKKQIDLEVTA